MMLVQYVRDKERRPVGVVVALNKNQIGWSKCNNKDHFDKKLGIIKATGRAMSTNPIKHISTPQCMREHVSRMADRAERYYKEIA